MRAVAASPSSPDTWISGSYDHTVRMWDTRQPKGSVLELSHGAPVEACLFLPGGGLCVSAGGNEVKVSGGWPRRSSMSARLMLYVVGFPNRGTSAPKVRSGPEERLRGRKGLREGERG